MNSISANGAWQDETAITGSLAFGPSSVANRVSYHLDLRGPSIPVDTACSSTLTATHLAIQALLAGDCLSAVVGGAQLNLRLALVVCMISMQLTSCRMIEWLQYSSGGIMSADGKCKPFDASADG
jgi:acyl transferase domain-containing protein